MDVYITWFSANNGRQADPIFPAIVDTVMMALRYSQPNPYEGTDPATGLTSSVYNTGEQIGYRIGVEATADERWLRYDALLSCLGLGRSSTPDPKEVPVTLAAYNGHEALTFGDYPTWRPGRTLRAEPGGVYDIAPASGRVVAGVPRAVVHAGVRDRRRRDGFTPGSQARARRPRGTPTRRGPAGSRAAATRTRRRHTSQQFADLPDPFHLRTLMEACATRWPEYLSWRTLVARDGA